MYILIFAFVFILVIVFMDYEDYGDQCMINNIYG